MIPRCAIFLVVLSSLAYLSMSEAKAADLRPPTTRDRGSNNDGKEGHIEYLGIDTRVGPDVAEKVDMDAPPQRKEIPILVNVEARDTSDPKDSRGRIATGVKQLSIVKPDHTGTGTVKTTVEKVGLAGNLPLDEPAVPVSPQTKASTNGTTQNPKNGSAGFHGLISFTLIATSLISGIIIGFANKKIIV